MIGADASFWRSAHVPAHQAMLCILRNMAVYLVINTPEYSLVLSKMSFDKILDLTAGVYIQLQFYISTEGLGRI